VAPELAAVTLAHRSARRDGIAQMNKPTGELFAALQRELHLAGQSMFTEFHEALNPDPAFDGGR
jgi:hypothetical protein